MAASSHFSPLTPKTLSLHHSSSPAPSLLTPCSLKPLPQLVLALSSIKNYAHPTSRFVPKFSVSYEFDKDLEEGEEDETLEQSSPAKRRFSPDLKLFVGNLPFSVDSAVVAGLFQQAGGVELVEVIFDKSTGRSKGYAFVTMSTVEEVEAAVRQFNGYELMGRALRVNSGPPPPKSENSSIGGSRGREWTSSDDINRLYVVNLSWDVDNLALQTLFGDHGKVKEAFVVYDKESGRSRGFGFVTYSSPDEVNNAIEVLDGTDLNGRTIRVSPAEPRPIRQ